MDFFFQILLIALLVFLNGFFVGAEFSLVKVRPAQIDERIAAGLFSAKIAKTMLNNLDAYLSACQVGITLASLALGWIGEPFLARLIEPLFRNLGFESERLVHGFAFGIAFAIITYLHIVVGEMAPKSLSIRLAEKTTLWIAIPLFAFYKVFYPFILILNSSSLFLLKMVGVSACVENEVGHSEEELRRILVHSAKSGQLTGREAEIMENVLALNDKTAKQIMIPRTAVAYLVISNTFSENLDIVEENEHTRYPLCDGDLDRVLGVVHIKDVLAATIRKERGMRMIKLKRDVVFYPETITLDALFREFQHTKLHMAVLIDEYGGTTGIVTLEDVLEELVGEIYDEFDTPAKYIRQVGKKEFLLDGLCPVKTCEEQLKITFPEFDVETIGGVVFSLAGSIPNPGDRVTFERGHFLIEVIDRQRIAKVRLILEDNKSEMTVE
ncbi:MAG: hemolysin family protein [bacterium]